MKITDLRVQLISAKLARPYWMSLEPYQTSSEIVVEIETDTGVIGIGEVHGRPLEQISAILTDVFAPVLRGRDPLEHSAIWEELFLYAHSRRGAALSGSHGQPHFGAGARPQLMAAMAGVRAGTCMMPVASRMRCVLSARCAKGVTASLHQASAENARAAPSRSA